MYIFIFRRDFRMYDNTAFIQCCNDAKENNETILPLFIYNNDQIEPTKNKYFSNNSMQFIVESLDNLSKQLQGNLYKMHISSTKDEVKALQKLQPKRVYFNKDLTVFAHWRDKRLQDTFSCVVCEDYTLFKRDNEDTKTNEGTAYLIVSGLYKKHQYLHKYINRPKQTPSNIPFIKKGSVSLPSLLKKDEKSFYTYNPQIKVHGGRDKGLDILKKICDGKFDNYTKARDYIAWDDTTHLSAYVKYGCISIREFYYAAYDHFGIDSDMIRELYFREFYTDICYYYPRCLKGQLPSESENKPLDTTYQPSWDTKQSYIDAWDKGRTGFPLIDAGMRELNTTGYMHNRVRMNVASIFCKNMYLDWRIGERLFAQKLVDYDVMVNNQSWLWSCGQGSDSMFYRIFSPYAQMKRFDPKGEYIYKWVPELHEVSISDLKDWENSKVRKKYSNINYPEPIIDHKKKAEQAKERFYSSKKTDT